MTVLGLSAIVIAAATMAAFSLLLHSYDQKPRQSLTF